MTARNKQIRGERFERQLLELDRRAASQEDRTVPAALSSETLVERWFGNELLVHEPDAIDLSRANGLGLPLLWNHDQGMPIGRIEGIRLDPDRIMRGTLRFSRNRIAEEVWNDVRDGFLNGVSIGYRVIKWEEQSGSDDVRVTRWQPIEASIVSVPADASVGLNRSASSEVNRMSESNGHQTDNGDGQVKAVATMTEYRAQFEAGKKAAEREVRARESERMLEIEEIFSNPLVPSDEFFRSLKQTAIKEAWSPDQVRRNVMDALAGEVAEVPRRGEVTRAAVPNMGAVSDTQQGIGRRARVEAGADETEKLDQALEQAILLRANLIDDREQARAIAAGGYAGQSLLSMGREFLTKRGVPISGKSDRQIAGMMIRAGGVHTGSDFSNLLANVATKSTFAGWQEANTTWQMWCNTGSLPDFKQATIAGLGAFPDLDQIPRSGGPYQHATMDDVGETAQLATYGKLFDLRRELIVNDDLQELTRAPRKMGMAAARKVNGLAYAVLTSNAYVGQTMTDDSTALFNLASHSNYLASGSGAAPSVATLNAALAYMRKQKAPLPSGDTSAAYLNIEPAYIMTVPDLEGTVRALIMATYDPAGTTASVSKRDAPNIWKDRLQIVIDPVLTLATGWWLAAAKNGPVDTVTVFFLNGRQEPYLEEVEYGTSDGITYKVRIDAVARALDYRGLFFNYGA